MNPKKESVGAEEYNTFIKPNAMGKWSFNLQDRIPGKRGSDYCNSTVSNLSTSETLVSFSFLSSEWRNEGRVEGRAEGRPGVASVYEGGREQPGGGGYW